MQNLLLPKILPFLCVALSALPSAAQEGQVTNLRFVTFPVYTADQKVELFIGEGKTVPIELPTNSLSQPYKLEGINKCLLGKTVVNEEGDSSFVTYGQTPVLSSKDQIILVTREGEKASDGFKLTPFDASRNGFNGGRYLMMNASNADIAGTIGETKFAIKPNKHVLLAPKPSKVKNGRKYLFTTVYFRKGDIVRPFYTSTWRFSDQARCMVFFHHDENTKQLRTHTIRNYIE